MPPSPHYAEHLPSLTFSSPPPPNETTSATQRPKRSALEPPAFTQNRSTSPRSHATVPRQRATIQGTASRRFQNTSHHRPRVDAESQGDLAALVGWSPDALNHVFTSSPQADNEEALFLNEFVDVEFSSPSNYPSFTTSNGSPAQPPTRTTSGASTSTNTTTSRILHDLDIMPPARRRRGTNTSLDLPVKRRRTAAVEDDPFRSSSPPTARDESYIDLTADEGKADLEKIREESQRQKEENGDIIKLSAFQCVICMDDATNLTVTHCGHLYCADCLHSSLNVETTRGRCPMCRSKLDIKPREQYTTKTKGYYPLELKIMTRTKKGKGKMKSIS